MTSRLRSELHRLCCRLATARRGQHRGQSALLLLLAVGVMTLGSGMIFGSCGNNGCEETRETYLYTQLTATGRISLTTLYAWGIGQQSQLSYVYDTIRVQRDDASVYDSIVQREVRVDSLMLSASSPSSLEFILRPDTNYTQIRLQCTISDNGDAYQYDDTLSVWYEAYPYFIDMECGCSVFFDIRQVEVTHHLFRDVILKQSTISNEESVNVILRY